MTRKPFDLPLQRVDYLEIAVLAEALVNRDEGAISTALSAMGSGTPRYVFFSASVPPICVYEDVANTFLFVSISGTYGWWQWVLNVLGSGQIVVAPIPGKVSAYFGFCGNWIGAFLDGNYPSQLNAYTVVITGHSLGGVVAQTTAAYLTGLGYPAPLVVSLGCPRAGSATFAAAASAMIVLNGNDDPIPSLPPIVWAGVGSNFPNPGSPPPDFYSQAGELNSLSPAGLISAGFSALPFTEAVPAVLLHKAPTHLPWEYSRRLRQQMTPADFLPGASGYPAPAALAEAQAVVGPLNRTEFLQQSSKGDGPVDEQIRRANWPSVSSVSPVNANEAGFNKVIVKGRGFSANSFVAFGEVVAPSVTYRDPETLIAFAPPAVAGLVEVSVGTNATYFQNLAVGNTNTFTSNAGYGGMQVNCMIKGPPGTGVLYAVDANAAKLLAIDTSLNVSVLHSGPFYLSAQPYAMCFNADDELCVVGSDSGHMFFYSLAGGLLDEYVIPGMNEFVSVLFVGNDTYFAVDAAAGLLRFRRNGAYDLVNTLDGAENFGTLVMGGDGAMFYSSPNYSSPARVYRFDLRTLARTTTALSAAGGYPAPMCAGFDGKSLYALSNNGEDVFWRIPVDGSAWTKYTPFGGLQGHMISIQPGADGNFYASDTLQQVWKLTGGGVATAIPSAATGRQVIGAGSPDGPVYGGDSAGNVFKIA